MDRFVNANPIFPSLVPCVFHYGFATSFVQAYFEITVDVSVLRLDHEIGFKVLRGKVTSMSPFSKLKDMVLPEVTRLKVTASFPFMHRFYDVDLTLKRALRPGCEKSVNL